MKKKGYGVSCTHNIKNNLEQYHLNHLKLLQLLLDGDVESNPGPVDNYVETPKRRLGRPKKTKGVFKGKKLNFSQSDGSNSITVCKDNFKNKIIILKSDITTLNCNAIVNAANITLLGGGGIDGKIHAKAGPLLSQKCRNLPVKGKLDGHDVRCYPGECEVTDTEGTKLSNCKYVFHTVGPDCRRESNMNLNASILRSCYENCLQNVLNYSIKSIAFCCISTGIFNYDNTDAANVAIDTVQSWLARNHQSIDKIIFCTYEVKDYNIYNELLTRYFPGDEGICDNQKEGCISSSCGIEMSEHISTIASTSEDALICSTNEDFDLNECFPCDDKVDDEIEIFSFYGNSVLNECFPSDENVPNELDGHLMKANLCTTSSTSESREYELSTSFAGTSNTINCPIATTNMSNRNFPVKLQNKGVNVCFFNSICQVLYSIPAFQTYLEQINLEQFDSTMHTSERELAVRRINVLKNLFSSMISSTGTIRTSDYVIQYQFKNYTFRMQHDAQEALNEILETCYPQYALEDSDHHMFRIQFEESIVCDRDTNGCGESNNKYTYDQILRFPIRETNDWQNVNDILIRSFSIEMPDGYACKLGPHGGCQKLNTCKKKYEYQQIRRCAGHSIDHI